jgi:hypothetical protein
MPGSILSIYARTSAWVRAIRTVVLQASSAGNPRRAIAAGDGNGSFTGRIGKNIPLAAKGFVWKFMNFALKTHANASPVCCGN